MRTGRLCDPLRLQTNELEPEILRASAAIVIALGTLSNSLLAINVVVGHSTLWDNVIVRVAWVGDNEAFWAMRCVGRFGTVG